jgi:hypothetical protein
MALSATQLQEASAVAVQYIRKQVPDILSQLNPLYAQMVEEQKEYVSGGTKIQMAILYQENAAKGFIAGDGTDVVSINPNQVSTYGELNWKYYYSNVSITLDDLVKTQDTPLAIKGLLQLKTAHAKNSMVRDLSSSFYGSAATNIKAFNGFGDIFAASGTAYAGINDTDVPNWFPLLDSTAQVTNYANINNNVQRLKVRIGQSPMDGYGNNMNVDLMLSNYYVLAQFMNSEQIKVRYQPEKDLKSGFDVVKFNGGIPWFADSYAPGSADGVTADNQLFILSKESFRLFYKYGFGEQEAPLDTRGVIPNQPVQYDVNYLAGNMGCTNRRVNAVMKTLKS